MSYTNEEMVNRIRDACKKKGITVSALEKKLGWSPGLISRWVKYNSPSIDKVIDISRELEISIAYLVGEADTVENTDKHKFETAIIDATVTNRIIWEKLLDNQDIFDSEVINLILDEDTYNDSILYHFFDSEVGHYVLVLQWNDSEIVHENNADLKLFSIVTPHAYPILKIDDKDKLMHMLRVIDGEVHYTMSVAEDGGSEIKFVKKYAA